MNSFLSKMLIYFPLISDLNLQVIHGSFTFTVWPYYRNVQIFIKNKTENSDYYLSMHSDEL